MDTHDNRSSAPDITLQDIAALAQYAALTIECERLTHRWSIPRESMEDTRRDRCELLAAGIIGISKAVEPKWGDIESLATAVADIALEDMKAPHTAH